MNETPNVLVHSPLLHSGGNDGPSGVLVCSENYITYKNLGDQPDIRCPIPRRRVSPWFQCSSCCTCHLISQHETPLRFLYVITAMQSSIWQLYCPIPFLPFPLHSYPLMFTLVAIPEGGQNHKKKSSYKIFIQYTLASTYYPQLYRNLASSSHSLLLTYTWG